MKLCSLDPCRSCLPLHFGAQRLAQEGERSEPFDPAQAGLDVEERVGQPAVLLIRGTPVRDVAGPLADKRIDGAASHCRPGPRTQARLDVTDQLAATCTQEWRGLPRGPESAVPTKPLPAGNRRAPPTYLTSLETTRAPPLSMRGSPSDRLPSLLTLYHSALRGRRQRTRPSSSVHRRGCLKLRTLLTITPRSSCHVLNRRK
jgi:hypothetical protein